MPAAADVVVGDLSSLAGMRQVAEQADAAGPFDAIIHNAGVGHRDQPRRVATEDGLARVFAVNVLAPYLLTALIERPARLVYLSSGLHRDADAGLGDAQWERRPWNGFQAYSDSKLLDVVLTFAVARRWPDVLLQRGRARAGCRPRWAARARRTTVAGPGDAGLAGGQRRSGGHRDRRLLLPPAAAAVHPAARDVAVQDELLGYCARLAGAELPP